MLCKGTEMKEPTAENPVQKIGRQIVSLSGTGRRGRKGV